MSGCQEEEWCESNQGHSHRLASRAAHTVVHLRSRPLPLLWEAPLCGICWVSEQTLREEEQKQGRGISVPRAGQAAP